MFTRSEKVRILQLVMSRLMAQAYDADPVNLDNPNPDKELQSIGQKIFHDIIDERLMCVSDLEKKVLGIK